ncbi:MAG TPA: hypothetical protein VNM47_03335 [Terriglobia bacterium]|nr:hypothetical protein [Terriglobia bacterium]
MNDCARNAETSGRFYRLLLFLYPPDFRTRFGREMVQVWQDVFPLERTDGILWKRLAFWLRTFEDLGRSLFGEWRQAVARNGGIGPSVATLAESVVVPLAICGSLTLAGFTVAVLTRRAIPRGFTSPGLEWQSTIAALETGAVVMVGLGIAGALGAYLLARRCRTTGLWIKL